MDFNQFIRNSEEFRSYDFAVQNHIILREQYVKVKGLGDRRQLTDKGYKIKNGVIQDASFIEMDVGKKRYCKEKKAINFIALWKD